MKNGFPRRLSLMTASTRASSEGRLPEASRAAAEEDRVEEQLKLFVPRIIARALDARKRRLASSRPPYSPPSLDEISDRLQVMIGVRLGGGFRVANLQHL